MCYKKPGPRCSSHAEKRLTRLEETRGQVIAESRSVLAEYRSAVEEFKANPENKKVASKARDLRKSFRSLKEKKEDLDQEIHLAQRDFDGTHKGQKLLAQQLASFDKENGDFDDYADLSNRRTAGKMFYAWRKNQLELQEKAASSGKTLKERRGQFLTLADRFDADVIEIDEQVLDAITNMNTPNRSRKLISA